MRAFTLVMVLGVAALPACGAPPADTDDALRGTIEEVLAALELRVESVRPVGVPGIDEAWQIRTPGLRTWFADERVLLRPRDDASRWDLELNFTAWGREGALAPAPVTSTQVDGARITLDRGALDEWYLDRHDGLEQGFTLRTPPSGSGDLLIEMAVVGGTARPDGDGVALYAGGVGRVRYDGLAVVDAHGASVPSSLELEGCEDLAPCALRIRVDDRGAAWPLEVDPLLTSLESAKVGLPGDGWAGYAVDVDSDRAIVGIPGDLATNPDAGRVVILDRNKGGAGVWGIDQTLEAAQAIGYGAAVAIDYPYAAVGAPGSARVYVYQHQGAANWVEIATLTKPNGAFGTSLAISGDAVLVGDPHQGLNAGGVFAFHRLVPPGWGEVVLDVGGPQPNDRLGASVAMVGATLVVGAPGAGEVRILERDGFDGVIPRFSEAAILEGSGEFGASVTFDGNRLAIGAPGASTVHLHERDGVGGWAYRAELAPPEGTGATGFGRHVTLDATTVAVTAADLDGRAHLHLFEDTPEGALASWVEARDVGETSGGPLPVSLRDEALVVGLPEQGSQGAVAIFAREAARWVSTDLLGTSDLGIPPDNTQIGSILSMDGRFLAVGMPGHDAHGLAAGGVAVLERDGDDPTLWTLDDLLEPPVWFGKTAFGSAVSLEGQLLLVGARADDSAGLDRGIAYIYERSSSGWNHAHTLEPSVSAAGQNFGSAVALEQDVAFVGAPEEDGGSGALYVFARHHAGTANAWAEIQRIGGASGSRLGASVAADFPFLAIGAPEASPYAAAGGAVRVYRFENVGSGYLLEQMVGSATTAGAKLGTSVLLHGDLLLAGAPREANGGTNRGAVHVYRRSGGGSWSSVAVLGTPAPWDHARFGEAVALIGDEAWIGSPGRNRVHGFGRNAGGSDAWGHIHMLAPKGASGIAFGSAVEGDGSLLIVGAPMASGDDGQLFVYRRDAPFAPVAVGHAFEMDEDGELAGDVSVGAFDANGDALTAVLDSGPSHGDLTFEPDGTFVYTPNPDYFGSDEFTYRLNDGELQSPPAQVTIAIAPVNDAPVAHDDAYVTDEDVGLSVTAPGVLGNDEDVDLDDLVAVLDVDVAHGTLELASDGSFVYQPDPEWSGVDAFTYVAFDGLLESEPVTVTITVNHVPKKPEAYDSAWETVEDEPIVTPPPGLLAYAYSRDGDVLIPQLLEQPEHGYVILRPNGSFDYHPPQYWHGETSFTWSISNGTDESEPALVEIVVHSVNNPPFATDDAYQVVEDRVLTVATQAGVLANDHDVDDEHPHASLEAWLATPPSHGTLLLSPDGSFEYTPWPDYYGTDGFQYFTADPDGGQSEPATVIITVLPENDAPLSDDDLYVYDPEEGLDVDAEEGVLANDVDVDGDVLQAVLVDQPRNGTVELHASGAFVYEPDPGFIGDDWFVYVADDGELISLPARVGILVTGTKEELEPEDEEPCTEVYFVDRDGDGYGDEQALVTACEPGPMLVDVGGDCDDRVTGVNPGAKEYPGDGVDQDCDGLDGGYSPVGACAVGAAPGSAAGLLIGVGLLLGRRRRRISC